MAGSFRSHVLALVTINGQLDDLPPSQIKLIVCMTIIHMHMKLPNDDALRLKQQIQKQIIQFKKASQRNRERNKCISTN